MRTAKTPDAQADLSLRWAHSHFVGFVMGWLIFLTFTVFFFFFLSEKLQYKNLNRERIKKKRILLS